MRRSKARPSRGDAPSRCTAGRWCLTGVATPTPRSRRRWRFARSPAGRRLSHRSKCTRACGWIRCRRSSPRTTRRARCGRVRTVASCVEKLLCFPAAQHAPSSAPRQHRRQQQDAHQQTEGRRHAVGGSSCEQEARGAQPVRPRPAAVVSHLTHALLAARRASDGGAAKRAPTHGNWERLGQPAAHASLPQDKPPQPGKRKTADVAHLEDDTAHSQAGRCWAALCL